MQGRGSEGRCQEDRAEKPGVADATTNSLPKLIFFCSLSIIKLDMGLMGWWAGGGDLSGAWAPPFTVHCRLHSHLASRPPLNSSPLPDCPAALAQQGQISPWLQHLGGWVCFDEIFGEPLRISCHFPLPCPQAPFVPLKASAP